MTSVNGFFARRPVLLYYALVFTISWGSLLILTAATGIPQSSDDVTRLMPWALVATFAGPSVSGLLMTWLVGGRAGFRDLRSRLLRWRAGARWYAAALLTGPLLVAAILFGLSLVSPAFTPGIVTADQKLTLVLFGIGWGLVGGGLLEELGWTGFAVPRLRVTYGAVTTGLVVGVLWGVWHFGVAFRGSRGMSGEGSLAEFVAGFLIFYLGALPAYRVLMVRVYDRTASLFLAMLMHAVFSASLLILPPGATGAPYLTWNALLAGALWLIVAAVAPAGREQPATPARDRMS